MVIKIFRPHYDFVGSLTEGRYIKVYRLNDTRFYVVTRMRVGGRIIVHRVPGGGKRLAWEIAHLRKYMEI